MKQHKKYLYTAITLSLLQLVIFKILYPYPDFISDSYSYIETNLKHLQVNLWPIGYSIILRAIHFISPSHLFLVVCQFIVLQAALLYFFISVLQLYTLTRLARRLLFIFLFANPMFVYLANCVLSDAIFCAITLVLFVQYLKMLQQPRLHHLVIQTLLIALAFTIRYTAIYYPLVSIAALLMARYRLPVKLAAIAAPWLLIVPFIIYTQQKTKEVTGTAEFSVFGGWQIANNALYMYEHIQVDSTQLPEETRMLDKVARFYFRKIAPQNPPFTAIQGTYFIKMPNAILKPYLAAFGNKKVHTSFEAWGSVSPVYNKYGTWLIRHYPLAFAQHYLWLNTQNYFVPYLEKFGSYNVGGTKVWEDARIWFQLPGNQVSLVPSIKFQGYVFYIYPVLFMLLNFYFAFSLLYFFFSAQQKAASPLVRNTLLLTAVFLLVNFGFSVFATPVVLRYQVVPMILLVCFSLYLATYPEKAKKL